MSEEIERYKERWCEMLCAAGPKAIQTELNALLRRCENSDSVLARRIDHMESMLFKFLIKLEQQLTEREVRR